jgi:hypothetical protein
MHLGSIAQRQTPMPHTHEDAGIVDRQLLSLLAT